MKRPLVFGEKNPIDSKSKWDHEKMKDIKKNDQRGRGFNGGKLMIELAAEVSIQWPGAYASSP